MILRKYYPTIVLSDIHLGSEHSRTEEVTHFLKHVDCDRLILNGDIIDGWQLIMYNYMRMPYENPVYHTR